MADSNCDRCPFRAKYDRNSRSILGRVWRWHANWCPGWKAHMKKMPEEERIATAQRYGMTKYLSDR